jgi:molecular chaperone DnaJ
MPQAGTREWFEKDYYKVLGVPQSATEKEITRAYRKLAKQYHPDAHPGSEDRFKEISSAYDVLGDPAKRKEYDDIRKLGPLGGFAGNGRSGFNVGNVRVDDLGDIGDLLGNLFGKARGGRSAGAPMGARRGDDLEASLHLSFMDAVNGITTSVSLVSDAVCSMCSGTGAAPGTSPVVCDTCNGRGVMDEDQGLFSFSQPCRACAGRGMKVETPCPTCNGSGVERRPRQVKVRIPSGVADGQRIRLKGRGGLGRDGGPPGDLYVVVRVDTHPLFGRRGRNLTVTLPVTFAEATLGATIKVPTLDSSVSLKVPPGTPSGKTFRVKGRGIAASGTKPAGDLLVRVEVAVPEQLTQEQRAAVEALAAQTSGTQLRSHLGVS